jgi:flavin reductase (DIM6/NTAB) family NADH-FMN oxidoreductase RutF
MALRPGAYLRTRDVDNGVSLVTSAAAGRQNVMTASFFAESSHVPVLLRVAIEPDCLTHDYVSNTGWFGLSMLASSQWEWAVECGSASGRRVDKLERLGIQRRDSRHGVPLLPDCLTTSLCRVVETVRLGDHTLFVGEIVESYRQSRLAFAQPLLLSELIESLGG